MSRLPLDFPTQAMVYTLSLQEIQGESISLALISVTEDCRPSPQPEFDTLKRYSVNFFFCPAVIKRKRLQHLILGKERKVYTDTLGNRMHRNLSLCEE